MKNNLKLFMLSCFCLVTLSLAKAQTVSSKITVITSFYPIYVMALNILKDIPEVKLVNLTRPQTGCLHDYQLTPEDMKTLESGNILIGNGAGMEAFLDKVIKQYSNLKIIISSKGIALIKNETHETKEEKHHHDQHVENNPHIFVSISLAIEQVKNIGNELQMLIPNKKDVIGKNTNDYIKKLKELKIQMHNSLDKIKERNIITFHEAFSYFAKEFNLNIVDVIEREPGSEPSAKELKNLIEKIKKLKIKVLFAEPQYSSKAAQTIANETESKVYLLDPAVTGPMESDAYIKIMNNNLSVLEGALK